jgi:hypothetical protein
VTEVKVQGSFPAKSVNIDRADRKRRRTLKDVDLVRMASANHRGKARAKKKGRSEYGSKEKKRKGPHNLLL